MLSRNCVLSLIDLFVALSYFWWGWENRTQCGGNSFPAATSNDACFDDIAGKPFCSPVNKLTVLMRCDGVANDRY